MAHECDDICRDLHLYLDGEATVSTRTVISVHLDECPSCAHVFRFESQVRLVVARCCAEPVPDSLRVRVLRAIYTADP